MQSKGLLGGAFQSSRSRRWKERIGLKRKDRTKAKHLLQGKISKPSQRNRYKDWSQQVKPQGQMSSWALSSLTLIFLFFIQFSFRFHFLVLILFVSWIFSVVFLFFLIIISLFKKLFSFYISLWHLSLLAFLVKVNKNFKNSIPSLCKLKLVSFCIHFEKLL